MLVMAMELKGLKTMSWSLVPIVTKKVFSDEWKWNRT